MKNVFICEDFNAPDQELNCTYNTENGDKIIETIETGTYKLLSNGYHKYQSYQCRNILDLLFANQSVFKFFDTFYVFDEFGSDHSSTITTLNIVTQNKFDLKSQLQKIQPDCQTRIQKHCALSTSLFKSRRSKSTKQRACTDHPLLATEVLCPTNKICLWT